MNDNSTIYINVNKYEKKNNQKKLFINKTTENNNSKQKSIYKLEKIKAESEIIDNTINKNNPSNIKKNLPKNIYCKKRANSYYNTEKINCSNNELRESKKLKNNKSYTNFNNERNSNINNKNIKKEINNNNNINTLLNNNTNNNKVKKKIVFNNVNNTNTNNNDNMDKNCINNIAMSPQNKIKFRNICFNTVFNNENKKRRDIYFSHNFENKKNNKIKENNLTICNDENKKKLISETENEYIINNNGINQFSMKKSKYSFDNLNINDNNSKDNQNQKDENNNNDYYYRKHDNSILNNNSQKKYKPIKLFNDKTNNTTINLGGSYNFHQYFNTIISNKNNDNNSKNNYYNNSPTNNSFISFIYNKNNDINNNVGYTQLNSHSNKNKKKDNTNNTIKLNEKIIDEINEIQDEMNKSLKQNPTNSKTKKYNILKHSFENFLKLIYSYELNILLEFLQQLLIGYHDVFTAFSSENRKLKELNYKLTEQYEKIDKNLIENNKIIKDRQKKIEILENKLYGLVNNMKNKNVIREYHINMKEFDLKKSDESQNNKIKKINERNLDDLDALYFFDKIEAKPNRSFSGGKMVPILPINKKK